jgi:hypothetical protein
MRMTRFALLGAMAFSLAAISAPAAQQSEKAKKPPKQTPDKGVDESTPSAQERKTGERDVAAVAIVPRTDGSVMAILDESFEDALVATVKADGSIAYTCLHGLPAGAKHVASQTKPVSVTPAAEEK